MPEPPSPPHSPYAVWLALITAVSTIAVAMIANWNSLFPDRAAKPSPGVTPIPGDVKPKSSQLTAQLTEKAGVTGPKSQANAASAPDDVAVTDVPTPHTIRVNFAYSSPCREWIGYRDYRTGDWRDLWITRKEAMTSSTILMELTGRPATTDYGSLLRVAVPLELKYTLKTKIKKLRDGNMLDKHAVRMTLVDGVFTTPTLKCE